MRHKKKRQFLHRVTTFITLFALLFTFSGFFGAAGNAAFPDEANEAGTAGIVIPIRPEGEICERRNEFEKHHANEDGTVTAYAYATAVHYRDDNGNWRDINNDLIMKDGCFENTDSPNKITLAGSARDDGLASIRQGEYVLSWGIQGINNSQGYVLAKPEVIDRKYPASLVSKLRYDNVFENTSLAFTLSSYTLSEDLIFDKAPAFDQVTYNIKTQNLTAVQVGKEVVFYCTTEEGREIFRFKAPFMYDSSLAITYEIAVSLEATADGYTLIYVLDRGWLLSDERVYPVTLDPYVYSWQHALNVEDTYVNYVYPDTNYGYSPWLYVGMINSSSDVWVKITNLPSIPSGATIDAAKLELIHIIGTTTWGLCDIWELGPWWNSLSLTANNQWTAAYSYLHGGISAAWDTTLGTFFYSADVTSTARKWYNGTMQNWGLTTAYQYYVNNHNVFYSSDHGSIGAWYLPALLVYYTDPQTPPPSYPEATSLGNGQVYYIKNAHSDQYLTIGCSYGEVIQSGSRVEQQFFYGGLAQRWKVTHMGNGEYKISSMYNSNLCLDVTGASPNFGTKMQVHTDNATAAQRFSIQKAAYGAYNIYTLTSIPYGQRAVAVQSVSLSPGTAIIQDNKYGQGNSYHCEWLFEPLVYTPSLGVEYAKTNCYSAPWAYPYCIGQLSDCMNFVSQCLLAGGKHYNTLNSYNTWEIYRKNLTYKNPSTVSQLDYSWQLCAPNASAWTSTPAFTAYQTFSSYQETHSGLFILSNPVYIHQRQFGPGDVIIRITNGTPDHAMYITEKTIQNGLLIYNIAQHSPDNITNLFTFISQYPNASYLFLRMS